ncbi:MAG: UDP-N-acetylmuramoyl-tripeptide--D-alanyl-D-alanine ligase [Neomegalonema sp.]|nr:UDP-N-acetylmuramoyl-tripeptide--D-alanyl-D-alanine ligase [Neomegalonema sp.]
MTDDAPAQAEAALWTADEAAASAGGRLSGRRDWRARGVAIDSREVQQGDLFVALIGAQSDGHRYIKQALAAGAVAALSAHPAAKLRAGPFGQEELPADAPLIEVADTLQALRALGAAARARPHPFACVGVTGSVGKTSTKEMLVRMFAAQEDGADQTHAPVKSFNNHVGVPLTLARTPRGARYGVYEMGMNAPDEIRPLSQLARPHIAMITSIEAVHLAGFKDGIAGVAAAKAEIFEGLEPGGVAVVRRDAFTDYLSDMARAAGARKVVDFGEDATSARMLDIELLPDRTRVEARLHGRLLRFEIGAAGRHFAWNALGALAVVEAADGDVERAAAALADWRAVSGRGARMQIKAPGGGAFLLTDESYNANPASMRAAIETFAAAPVGRRPDGSQGKRLLFLTDMLELGPDSAALHAQLANAPGMAAIDKVHAAGPEMRALMDMLPEAKRGLWALDAEALAERASDMLEAGDAAMVKGSLGSRAQAIAAALRALGAA